MGFYLLVFFQKLNKMLHNTLRLTESCFFYSMSRNLAFCKFYHHCTCTLLIYYFYCIKFIFSSPVTY
ncbi:hypothetical protein XELAEV_18002912mg [Xenopus laevis]|uniref:Uncharacterized protein n=1 Tax=Xenopus laevis TaxID=8355 RepID=A0A974BNS7_XENLA|nr:hypothetical protein XELAEV_18002912mg [Xenopus laevis]